MIDYVPGTPLGEDEYLLKIRSGVTGFMSKLTKKGELPKSFDEWGDIHTGNYPFKKEEDIKLPIKIITEKYRSGWKIQSWRFGQSQNWATVLHPLGFTVEVYLQQLLEVFKSNTIINGELIGEFMWKDHKLYKK